MALGRQLDAQPAEAFNNGPIERVGAILNAAPALTREAVLDGLDAADAVFADQVRKAIFTYANIPQRLDVRDLPKITRAVNPTLLVKALAYGRVTEPRVTEHILENISQRQAQMLNDEIEELGQVSAKDGEAAMAELIAGIREMEASGEILLLTDD